MSGNDEHLAEDITAVANVQGLTTDPIGLNVPKAGAYKKKNEITKMKSFKEWVKDKNESNK